MDSDELDLLSAIWILASNDENHIISYEGVRHRLALPAHVDIKEMVRRRPELFRPAASPAELNEWKVKMRDGKFLSSWIRALPNGEKTRAIESLSVEDVFRSQFRAHRGSERSPIEIISWGLNHLDRLRKAKLEAREVTAKSWQMWLVFGVAAANVVITIIFKLLGK